MTPEEGISLTGPSPGAYLLLDDVCNILWMLMFPKAQYQPAVGCEESIRLPVPLHIAAEFLTPPFSIGLGEGGVLGTTVPETSIDHHGYPAGTEHNVRGAPDAFDQGSVQSVSEAAPVQFPSHGPLRPGAHRLLQTHLPTYPRGRG